MTTLPRMGEVFAGRYRLEERVAETPGYAAATAFDEAGEELIELWLVREELLPSPAQRDGVIRAAYESRDLAHPYIRRVRDAGLVQGQVYVAVELASSGGIRRRLSTGRASPESDVLLYATAIAEALEASHAVGLLHGRLIPEDVVSVDGILKVGGVGLWADVSLVTARRLWRPADRYLAPEVREVGQLSRAADVYSLAAILVELASGAGDVPIHQATQALVVEQPRLADVLTPALSPAPRHRPASPGELLRKLRQVLVDDKVPTGRMEAAQPDEMPPGFETSEDTSTGFPLHRPPAPRQDVPRDTLHGGHAVIERAPAGPRTLAGYPPPSSAELRVANESTARVPEAKPVVTSPAKRTDRIAQLPPPPGPRLDDPPSQPAFFTRSTAEAPAAYPEPHTADAPGSMAAGKGGGADPLRRRRRASSLNPLAEPAVPRSAPPRGSVTLLGGTASAPPRFAVSPPTTEVLDTRRDWVQGPVLDDGEITQLDVRAAPEASDARDTEQSFPAVEEPDLGDDLHRQTTDSDAIVTLKARKPAQTVEDAIDAAMPRTVDPDDDPVPELRETLAGDASDGDVETEGEDLPGADSEAGASLDGEATEVESAARPISESDIDEEEVIATAQRPAIEAPDDIDTAERVRPAPKLRSLADQFDRRTSSAANLEAARGGTATSSFPWGSLAIGVFLAVVLAFGTWIGLRTWSKGRAERAAGAVPIDAALAPAPEPSPVVAVLPPPCPESMVGVTPSGLDPFCIDAYEQPGEGQVPRTGLSFEEAGEACAQRGARLCSGPEWVAACRGPELATYPYGLAYVAGSCNIREEGDGEIAPSGSFERCRSAAGAFDMSGNVAEWTEGRTTYGGSAPAKGLGRCPDRVARPKPKAGYDDVGYRCCRSAGADDPDDREADSDTAEPSSP